MDLRPRKFTEANVKDLPSAEGRGYVVRDTELKGFVVIVNKRSASWAVQRDLWQGPRGRRTLVRSVRHTIGRVGIMPLRVAREKALEAIRLIQQGVDPNKPHMIDELTLGDQWREYEASLKTRGRSDRTVADFTYDLRYFQDWKHKALSEIGGDRRRVRERHIEITKKHGPYIANRAMRALRAAYNLALKVDDHLPANPVVAVTFNREKRRNEAIAPDDLADWWQKVEALENPIRRDLHKFLLLTGMRRTAAVTARWEHVDWNKRCLFVPKPKGGEDRAFHMPLSGYLLGLLRARQEGNEKPFPRSPWIWPAESKEGHVTEPKETKRGLPPPHVLRHSYATFAKAAGLNEMDIALLMNHKLPGVTGGYIHETSLIEHLKACQERVTRSILPPVVQTL
ncbi:MAG: tyrosine-type recombinase/integrase [Alphaproteobacteria bacterium]